ncbi:Acetate utilization protein FacB-like protein [Penicillium ucsense]|nr:Acetate utilization protein FacB-like protein [Penicillium ucsense]
MPGILPMKVIRVGGSQSRIAQACDRCRSKKIRCDGIRPCCTQCANVGFECKTSDKLSRRAFPRGYTESLEERVRSLEAEVKDLKELLDEKDEKIDVLSRIHSFSSAAQRAVPARSPSMPVATKAPISAESEGIIHVEQYHHIADSGRDTSHLNDGLSTTRGFAHVLNHALVGQGKAQSTHMNDFLTKPLQPLARGSPGQAVATPPRLVSDQLINIFFQEWAPMYPVVHRPTILKAYGEYLNDLGSFQQNTRLMAQLNLIFGVAALSSQSRTHQDPTFFEQNWTLCLDAFIEETSIEVLQCIVLAQIYCMTKRDYRALLRYRALAADKCHQLGLYHNPGQSEFNHLEAETRKKVFWCQYTMDRFCAALTGMPVILPDSLIQTELPVDIDDENVTESGFLPTLPGESTRISSALALFSASRILSKAMEYLYPSKTRFDIYVARLRAVSADLDEWLNALPPHLRLEFCQDKPSTNVTGSRSPLLSLVFYFIRSLIHRPAVCFAEEHVRSPSIMVVAESAKHILQILDLLDERRLCLSVSINREELVFFSGLGLLWQTMGLKRDSKLAKDSQKLLTTVVDRLQAASSTSATEFKTIAGLHAALNPSQPSDLAAVCKKSNEMKAPAHKPSKSPKKQLQSLKARISHSLSKDHSASSSSQSRRNTVPGSTPPLDTHSIQSPSWTSLPPTHHQQSTNTVYHLSRHSSLDLGNEKRRPTSLSIYDQPHVGMTSVGADPATGAITMADWEYVLSDMDHGLSNIFTGIYGGSECGEDSGPFASITADCHRKSHDSTLAMPGPLSNELQELSPEAWSASSGDYSIHSELPHHGYLRYSGDPLGSNEEFSTTANMSVRPDELNLPDSLEGLAVPSKDDVGEYRLAQSWDQRLSVQ